MTIRRHQAHRGHQLDSLKHDQGHSRGDGPRQEGECLLVIKEIPQPDLVVHDCLQTLDTLQLDTVPLGVTENYYIKHHPAFHYANSLPEALVEDIEDLLEPLVTEVLDPVQAVVGEGHSQRLYTVELLGEG